MYFDFTATLLLAPYAFYLQLDNSLCVIQQDGGDHICTCIRDETGSNSVRVTSQRDCVIPGLFPHARQMPERCIKVGHDSPHQYR